MSMNERRLRSIFPGDLFIFTSIGVMPVFRGAPNAPKSLFGCQGAFAGRGLFVTLSLLLSGRLRRLLGPDSPVRLWRSVRGLGEGGASSDPGGMRVGGILLCWRLL